MNRRSVAAGWVAGFTVALAAARWWGFVAAFGVLFIGLVGTTTAWLAAAARDYRRPGVPSPIASGSGRCPAVPTFDRFDEEVERRREGWVVLDRGEWDRFVGSVD